MEERMVSVIMITYLHEPFIGDAILGVLNQECNFPVELIIADDASPDKTESVVQSFSNHPNYSWIRYIKHEKNIGPNQNYLFAVRQATGKYIAVCEGDDYWTDSEKLQIQVDRIHNDETIALVSTRCHIKDESDPNSGFDTEHENLFHSNAEYVYTKDNFLYPYVIYTNSVLFRNQAFLKQTQQLKAFKDTYIYARLLQSGKGVCLNRFTGVYRHHAGGQWSSGTDIWKLDENLKASSQLLLEFNTPSYRFMFKQSFMQLHGELSNVSKTKEANFLVFNYWKACRNTFSLRELLRFIIGIPADTKRL